MIATIIAAAVATSAPQPGALRTFADWTVGCDNGLACTMASLMPEGKLDGEVTIDVARAPGLPGAIVVTVVAQQERDGARLALAIDGKALGTSGADGRFAGAQARAIVAAMATGRSAAVRGATGPVGTVSLSGAAAALRYIDSVQRRAGTASAIVAVGTSRAVPPTPALPTIVALRPVGTPARLSPAARAALYRRARCDLPEGIDKTPEVHALGGGKTLVIVPCSTGAYNQSGAVFVGDGARFVPAIADVPTGFAVEDDPGAAVTVVNGSFDAGVLASYAKGRGIGDCGVAQEFVYDGRRFRLSRQSQMGECRGNPGFITTRRTRVVRR